MLTSLPNLLTLMRILVIPPIIALFFWDGSTVRWVMFGLYVLACVTDYFDGVAARSMNQISKLGRFLDPIADKLLVASIILMLVASGQVSGVDILACLIILLREITVSGLREFLAELQVGMPVSKLAKWKTTIQMLALGFLIVGPANTGPVPADIIGLVLLWIAAVLTVVTGFDYLRAGLRHMT
ncbi:CDP-diacylglycerol--glycerol-3-phosphate 3-phosphatidyltransferase [Aestuariispira ectoiniformans]|uniref:CDP-diacylglycerol--glycerol-3-phosphate 3-phosphatidyltransferase n=1 Tax=Aestuariispira ectoiniformans TaxID=2775080 RepID=UPI00223C08A6|nr:CDP-diacylglycerol--glycerol-3-phosphate 3-phosphatidyltransferase [Aestuariispira ectoiniformans]